MTRRFSKVGWIICARGFVEPAVSVTFRRAVWGAIRPWVNSGTDALILASRYIAANTHPDHDTIANFLKQLEPLFLQILLLAKTMGFLKLGRSVWMGARSRRMRPNTAR